METIIKSNRRSFSSLTGIVIPILLVSFILLAGNTFAVRPVHKEKPVSSKVKVKKINTSPKPSTTDYLLYIMPSSITKVTKKNARYVKDANGVYTMVEEKGC